jgi:hypothetical protein
MDRYSSITALRDPALKCVRDENPGCTPKSFKQKNVVGRAHPLLRECYGTTLLCIKELLLQLRIGDDDCGVTALE